MFLPILPLIFLAFSADIIYIKIKIEKEEKKYVEKKAS